MSMRQGKDIKKSRYGGIWIGKVGRGKLGEGSVGDVVEESRR